MDGRVFRLPWIVPWLTGKSCGIYLAVSFYMFDIARLYFHFVCHHFILRSVNSLFKAGHPFVAEQSLLFAFSTSGTAVADDFHTTGLAFVAEIGLVVSLLGNRHTEKISELEVYGLAFEA